jgi:hypothetical protein
MKRNLLYIFRILGKQSIFLCLLAVYIWGAHSCANPGVGPQGGPRDSIPPLITESIPQNFQTAYTGNEIVLSFDEYVVADNLESKLIVSPPLSEKPTVKIKGKSISIKFNETLAENRTYSVDFKDLIKDYKEGNKIEGYRMLFSTYNEIDTLRIEGYLLDAFNHEPIENALATLYVNSSDTLFTGTKPDYIAQTDAKGYFMFDNLAGGDYSLFGLVDGDKNLFFSRQNEQIAFFDSLLSPSATFVPSVDTMINEQGDTSITISGSTSFFPPAVFAFLFLEKTFNQNLIYARREEKDRISLAFNEQLSDSFKYECLNVDDFDKKIYKEISENNDSILIWLIDSLVIQADTILLKLDYTVTDTLNNFVAKTDTLKLAYAAPRKAGQKNDDVVSEEIFFDFAGNVTATFDLNSQLQILAPLPITLPDSQWLSLKQAVTDSTFDDVDFTIKPMSKRKFHIDFEVKEATSYVLTIDSAVVKSYGGIYNNAFELKFKTQKADFYGTAIFNIKGFDSAGIVQLLKNSKDEDVVLELQKEQGQGELVFNYLKPGKYKVKLIDDANNNQKWDSGNYLKKIKPEAVYYFPKIINIKSNWELKEEWTIEPGQFKLKDFAEADKAENKNK